MTRNCCNFDKHDKLTQCCHAFTLVLARLSCHNMHIRVPCRAYACDTYVTSMMFICLSVTRLRFGPCDWRWY